MCLSSAVGFNSFPSIALINLYLSEHTLASINFLIVSSFLSGLLSKLRILIIGSLVIVIVLMVCKVVYIFLFINEYPEV